jgi:hypothetical protein
MKREIGWSLASAAVYGMPAGIVAWGWQNRGWTLSYGDVAAYPLWWLPVSVLLFLLAHDTWFSWTHRWMHRPKLFRLAHAVHHASRPPTRLAAMAFHPIEAVTGAVAIPLLVFVIPIHVAALGLVLAIMTVMGVTNHMGWEVFPRFMWRGPLGGWLITASHHQRHHEQYGCNYGLYFRFWDRLCGTDRGVGDFARVMPRRLVGAVLLAVASTMLAGATPVARLDVTVDQLRSAKGLIRVCLTADAANFPRCIDDADAVRLSIPAAQGRSPCLHFAPACTRWRSS